MKYLSFRFDVDTPKCILEGVPNLLKLSKKHKVPFTLFINFGRSIDQISFLKNKLFKNSKYNNNNLSALYKLGIIDYFKSALLNPRIIDIGKEIITKSAKQGFEIGLHGGTNHELWNQNSQVWSRAKIESEVAWGISQMKLAIPRYKSVGFASPHWKSSKKILRVLKKQGFSYCSDIHSDRPMQTIKNVILPNIPVNISGEPGGVGYLENCKKRGFSDRDILNDFSKKLQKRNKFAIVYDHPYYCAVKELAVLSQMIDIGKDYGYEITTLKKILKKFKE